MCVVCVCVVCERGVYSVCERGAGSSGVKCWCTFRVHIASVHVRVHEVIGSSRVKRWCVGR